MSLPGRTIMSEADAGRFSSQAVHPDRVEAVGV